MKIVIADDHDLVRLGLSTLLQRDPEVEVVAEASCGDGALEMVRSHRADLLILDLKMPGAPALDVIRLARAELPTVKVLILSAYVDESFLLHLDCPIQGYMLKGETKNALLQALRVIRQGASWFSPQVGHSLMGVCHVTSLTSRDKEILGLLARGLSNAEIARELHLAKSTVGSAISHLYGKLSVANRVEAALWAQRWCATSAETTRRS